MVKKDVFMAGPFGMKAGSNLKQTGNPAPHDLATGRWLGNAAEYLEQRALAGAVAPDCSQHFAALDFEGNILERPELIRFRRMSGIGVWGCRSVGVRRRY